MPREDFEYNEYNEYNLHSLIIVTAKCVHKYDIIVEQRVFWCTVSFDYLPPMVPFCFTIHTLRRVKRSGSEARNNPMDDIRTFVVKVL